MKGAAAVVVALDNVHGRYLTAISDARGQYRLALPPGRYQALASGPGYASGGAVDGAAEPIDLRKSLAAGRDFELVPLRRATGRVQDERGMPVEAALVSLAFEGMGAFYGRLDIFADE